MLCFFFLLLSFNGSPNSKLSRFFRQSLLFLFFFLTVFSCLFRLFSLFPFHKFMRLFLSYAIRCGENFLCSCSRRKKTSFYHHQQQRKRSNFACVFPKWSEPYTSSWRHRYLYWLRSLFLLLLFALNEKNSCTQSLSPTPPQKRHQRLAAKNSRAKNHYFTSRSSTFFSLCSLPLVHVSLL